MQTTPRTKQTLLTSILYSQHRSSKKRGHTPPNYTKQEFLDWALSQPTFHKLYTNWITNGCPRHLLPTCDRLDDYKGYSLNRLEFVTLTDNIKRSACSTDFSLRKSRVADRKPVNQLTLSGELLSTYPSISNASKQTGFKTSAISCVCNGKHKTHKGFIWEFA